MAENAGNIPGPFDQAQLLVDDSIPQPISHIDKRKIKFSVKVKFALFIALLLSLFILFITSYLLNQQENNLLSEMEYRAQIIAQNLSRNIAEIINDDTTRHQILTETMKIKDIEQIALIDMKNNLFDHTDEEIWKKILFSKFDEKVGKIKSTIDQKTIQQIVNKKSVFILENHNKENKFAVISPIKLEKTVLGILKIVFLKEVILNKIKTVQKNVWIFRIIAIIIGILSAYFLSTIIIKPIETLSEGAMKIGKGYLDFKINVNTMDELGQLADEFNNMTMQLNRVQKSMIEKERYDEQLEIAKKIQENLLPDEFPRIEGLQISAFYKAMGGIGGDYYDIVHLKDKNKISVIIADVAGKGVPAALVMVMIRTTFHAVSRFVNSPSEAIAEINYGITKRLSADRFATMFSFHYDYKNGILDFSNAAHPCMIFYQAETEKIGELDAEGVPVGIEELEKYQIKRIRVKPGDIILLLTDGITEAMNANNEMFRTNRIKQIVKANATLSADELKKKIISDIQRFVGEAEQHDDMTLVIFKITSTSTKIPSPFPGYNKM
ncbi:MAG: SpoIIE family protein phosphatase [Spirochaetes bacterium]|nr:SpoIIE family protein phosphatase [Spirochaetota bacterium]